MKKLTSASMTCPRCGGTGKNLQAGGQCSGCGGSGSMDAEFPFPYCYPFNMTILQGAYQANVNVSIPGSPGNPSQQGSNPVVLKLGNEGAFKWIFRMIHTSSPDVAGDASRFLQLALTDLSGGTWPFQNAPICADLVAGDAKLPFPEIEPLTFGTNTQLQLTGYPIDYTGIVLEIGVGTGSPLTFTGVLAAPGLRGSVQITNNAAGVITTVATDNGQGTISGTGITGTINYLTGALSVSSTWTNTDIIGVTYTQGCARIDCQFLLQGFYLRPYTDAEKAQIAQS